MFFDLFFIVLTCANVYFIFRETLHPYELITEQMYSKLQHRDRGLFHGTTISSICAFSARTSLWFTDLGCFYPYINFFLCVVHARVCLFLFVSFSHRCMRTRLFCSD